VDVESKAGEALWRKARFLELFRRKHSSLSEAEQKEFDAFVMPVIAENRVVFEKLVQLLDEFYRDSADQTPEGGGRIVVRRSPWYAARLMPEVVQARPSTMPPVAEKRIVLKKAEREMDQLRIWLQRRFFETRDTLDAG